MPKPSELPSPYFGGAFWSTDHKGWVITVYYDHGGKVPSEGFFEGVVLAAHLRRAGITSVFASHDTKRDACVVWRRQPGDLDKQGKKLLAVLETHYSQFKGRAVKWTVGQDNPYN